jgi:hypothetical protein
VIGERVKRLRRPDRLPGPPSDTPEDVPSPKRRWRTGAAGDQLSMLGEGGQAGRAPGDGHVEELTREVALLRGSLERAQVQLEQACPPCEDYMLISWLSLSDRFVLFAD